MIYLLTITFLILGSEINNLSSVDGKYRNLLHVIEVPGDKENYGSFHDWGYCAADAWAGYSNLHPGYWVYVYPKWYIWEKRSDEIGIDPKAHVNGKYSVLLHVVHVPEDQNVYGRYYDFGFWEGYNYAGNNNLTPGYWVYLAPNWYVWAETTDCTTGI